MIGRTDGDTISSNMITFDKTEDVTHEWTLMGIRSETPVILAAMQTFEGPNTANVRIRSYTTISIPWSIPGGTWEPTDPWTTRIFFPSVKVEEERSADVETRHTEEVVGHIAFEPGRIENSDGEEIGHAGILEVNQPDGDTWRPLPIPPSFSVDNSVAFMQVLSFNGSQSVHPRIATSHPETGEAGFHFKMEEWPTYDQQHVREQLGYVVLNEGRHPLGRGEDPNLEVGTTDPFNYRGNGDSWQDVQLGNFVEGTVVVTQCQTFNGSDPVVTRQSMLDLNEFEVRLQEAESQGDHPAEEVVGYVAMGPPLY